MIIPHFPKQFFQQFDLLIKKNPLLQLSLSYLKGAMQSKDTNIQ